MAQLVKDPPAMQETQETQVWSLVREDPLKKEMATCPSILAWKIPWTEEPGGLQFMGLQRVGQDCVPEHAWVRRISPDPLLGAGKWVALLSC